MCKHLWSIPYIKHGQTEMKSSSVSSDPSNIRYMEHYSMYLEHQRLFEAIAKLETIILH